MKKTILFLALLGSFSSCNKDNNSSQSDVIGCWKLSEVLADPGDGSGVFQAVESNKTIEFKSDGTVSCNGSLCDMSTESVFSSKGNYSETNATIQPKSCPETELRFEVKETSLIISYPCIEACRAKYSKVK